MKKISIRHTRPVSDHLHPLLYEAMAALALCFALAAWIFFGDASYSVFVLVVVTFFMLMTIALPFAIWQAWRGSPMAQEDGRQRFRDWAAGELETWQCRLSGSEAAIEILLPLMAVAFGLAILGLVLHFDVALPAAS